MVPISQMGRLRHREVSDLPKSSYKSILKMTNIFIDVSAVYNKGSEMVTGSEGEVIQFSAYQRSGQ